MSNKTLAGLFLVFISVHLHALETGWIELKKGSEDKDTGAVVREISKPDAKGNTTVTVAIPKTAVANTAEEEVVVYGQRPEKRKKAPIMDVRYEWVADYEQDYYGLVIKFGANPVLPIRLYLKSVETNKINP